MKNYKICIPSYNRPNWPALDWLDREGVPRTRIHLFLHNQGQLEAYRTAQDLEGIVIKLTGAKCMTDQRNFILEYMYPYRHVQMDDDVTGIRHVDHNLRVVKVGFQVTVRHMFQDAAIMKCKVWGTGVYMNPYFARKEPEVSFDKFFRNNLVGIDGYRPKPELVGPVGTDWELGLCAIRDRVGLVRFNRVVLDVSLGTDTDVLGGIGTERWRFNGDFFQKMAKRYVKVVGEKKLREFYPGLVKCLRKEWKHKCEDCGSGFWDDLHWKIHQLYPCKGRKV